MAILSAIRRWHFRDGASIREIARRSGLSRNTVRKYLQSKVVEPQYPARDSVGKLSPFEPKLRQWLSTEHKKTKKPVSYTHLDVYKRQVAESALFRMIGQMREIVTSAQKATRKARRDADRRQHLKTSARPDKPVPPDTDIADPQADNLPPAKPFDQIEEW